MVPHHRISIPGDVGQPSLAAAAESRLSKHVSRFQSINWCSSNVRGNSVGRKLTVSNIAGLLQQLLLMLLLLMLLAVMRVMLVKLHRRRQGVDFIRWCFGDR